MIVLAEYFDPTVIYFSSGGSSQSLDTSHWVAIQANNNVTEATYYTNITNITTGIFEVSHASQNALLNTVLFGLSPDLYMVLMAMQGDLKFDLVSNFSYYVSIVHTVANT